MKLEIAGLTIEYRNAPDLNEKVRRELLTAQARRKDLSGESLILRKREKALERFLGGVSAATDSGNRGGTHE
jgi:hypothetical protein